MGTQTSSPRLISLKCQPESYGLPNSWELLTDVCLPSPDSQNYQLWRGGPCYVLTLGMLPWVDTELGVSGHWNSDSNCDSLDPSHASPCSSKDRLSVAMSQTEWKGRGGKGLSLRAVVLPGSFCWLLVSLPTRDLLKGSIQRGQKANTTTFSLGPVPGALARTVATVVMASERGRKRLFSDCTLLQDIF